MGRYHRRFIRLFLTIVSLVAIIMLTRSIITVWQKGDVIQERKTELRKIEAENEALRRRLAEAQSPEFIEKQAREKLGMSKPGEAVVLMPPATEAAKMLEDLGQKPVPNWLAWWRLFF